jgi:hypothetical protein
MCFSLQAYGQNLTETNKKTNIAIVQAAALISIVAERTERFRALSNEKRKKRIDIRN